jgi:hypothetical protein
MSFEATLQESAHVTLRRLFVTSQRFASQLLKIILQLLCEPTDDWFKELLNRADETSKPHITKDGPWDVFIVFQVMLNECPQSALGLHGVLYYLISRRSTLSADASYDPEKLIRDTKVVFNTRNWWAHRSIGVEEAFTAADSLKSSLLSIRSILVDMCGETVVPHPPDMSVHITQLRVRSPTVEWSVGDIAFVLLSRGFSSLCDAAKELVSECRQKIADVDHFKHCHSCRASLIECCSNLNGSDVSRGISVEPVRYHLESCTRCAQMIKNCLDDVSSVCWHIQSCPAKQKKESQYVKCATGELVDELELVREARNLMFHSSRQDIAALVISTLECISDVIDKLNCLASIKTNATRTVNQWRDLLQSFLKPPPVQYMIKRAADFIRKNCECRRNKCECLDWLNLADTASASHSDVLDHVLNGTIPFSSPCDCFNSVKGPWLTVRSVLTNLNFMSNKVLSASPRTTSHEVASWLHSCFTSNQADYDKACQNISRGSCSDAENKRFHAAEAAVHTDNEFLQQLRASAPPSASTPSSADDIESIASLLVEQPSIL